MICLMGVEGISTSVIYNRLKGLGPLVCILEEPVSRRHLLARRIQKLGLPTVIGQLAFMLLIAKPLGALSSGRIQEILSAHQLDDTPIEESHHVQSVNSDEARLLLQSLDPSVVVLSGTRIVSSETLSCVECDFVNLHAGITPLYRGVHGAYWAYRDGCPDLAGVTLHLVDSGIDTGDILAQEVIRRTETDNFATFPLLQLAAGLPHLVQAIESVLQGNKLSPYKRTDLPSMLRYHPTLWEYVTGMGRGVR